MTVKTIKPERFIEDFIVELESDNIAIFAGAGLSAPIGFVDWKSLLKPLAEDIDLDVDKEYDLVSLAQYHVNHHGNSRSDLNQVILNNFSKEIAEVTENHRILTRLPISTYWTTNYDTAIEDSLRKIGKKADVKHSIKQLPQTEKGRDAVVYKMHGDVHHPADAILCKSDYERYHIDNSSFITALSGDLVSKTFLFIGFSFNDPNLDYVLSRLRINYGENQRKHYCFIRKEPDNETDESKYRRIKQEHFIIDLLHRYNIRTILVDEYQDITKILRKIECLFKRKTIFVSGAAVEYGTKWTEHESLEFVQGLGRRLIKANHRIVSGLGLGIGSALIDGALQEVYHHQRRKLQDDLVIRPFPQSEYGKKIWTQYREEMLDYAGISIFMFGNKLSNDKSKIIESNGMEEEFSISVKKGVKVLPLGFTGYMAKTLWERVLDDFGTYHPGATQKLITAYKNLGETNLTVEQYFDNISIALNEIMES